MISTELGYVACFVGLPARLFRGRRGLYVTAADCDGVPFLEHGVTGLCSAAVIQIFQGVTIVRSSIVRCVRANVGLPGFTLLPPMAIV